MTPLRSLKLYPYLFKEKCLKAYVQQGHALDFWLKYSSVFHNINNILSSMTLPIYTVVFGVLATSTLH